MLGHAAVTIWCDVASGARPEFDDWHAHEHMPERLSIPGFLRGSRWVSSDGGYFMLYEAADEATVTTGPYIERLNNPTPWSRKMMSEHRNMVRAACRVQCAFGAALGGALLTARFSSAPRLATELLQALASRRGLVAAALLHSIPSPQTTEQKLRGGDAGADWIVLVSGYDADVLASLPAREMGQAAVTGLYELACVMSPGPGGRRA